MGLRRCAWAVETRWPWLSNDSDMTPDEHNKWLGYAHLAYASLHAAMGVFFGVMMAVIFITVPSSPRQQPPPPAFIAIMFAFILVMMVGWVVPSIIASYALLKRKRWAKTASIVAGVFAAAQMPLGTAVAVYTFWFTFGEMGRRLYDQSKALPAPDSEVKDQNRFISAAPPDWR